MEIHLHVCYLCFLGNLSKKYLIFGTINSVFIIIFYRCFFKKRIEEKLLSKHRTKSKTPTGTITVPVGI